MAKKECDCVLCKCKCPECGSTNIRVKCGVVYHVTSDTENSIAVETEWGDISLVCDECQAMPEHGLWKQNESLKALRRALLATLDTPTLITVTHKEGGEIDVRRLSIGPLEEEED